jgi:folate-binding protein YgfZ
LGSNGFPSASADLVGTARYTSFTTAHGVLQAYVRCLVTDDDVKLVCEGSTLASLAAYLDSRIFPSDNVRVADETARSAVALHVLCAPSGPPRHPADGALMALGDARRSDVAFVTATATATATAAGGEVVTSYTLPADGEVGATTAVAAALLSLRQLPAEGNGEGLGLAASLGAALPSLLRQAAGTGADDGDTEVDVWAVEEPAAATAIYDQLRAASGRLTDQDWRAHNVTALEAGLMHAIDFRKGCFVGQEAISRALASARRNADGTAAAVRRRVARLVVEATGDGGPRPATGDVLVDADGDAVGAVLTVTDAEAAAALLRPEGRYRVRGGAAERVGAVGPAPGPALAGAFGTAAAAPGTVQCLGLVKTVFAVADPSSADPTTAPGAALYVQPASDPSTRLRVAAVAAAPYPTYNPMYSPAPPVEKKAQIAGAPGSGDAADADAVAKKAAEEAARKEAKLAEMAKKVAALKKRSAA